MGQQLLSGGLGLGQKAGIAADVCHPQPRQAVLPKAEEVAGAAEPQVLLGNFEAVGGFRHGAEPLTGLVIFVVGHQHAVGLVLPPAHPAPKLVELAEAEALRVFHHHQTGVGNVHAHFNDGGGHQNIRFSCGKGGHYSVFFPGLHFAVDIGNP